VRGKYLKQEAWACVEGGMIWRINPAGAPGGWWVLLLAVLANLAFGESDAGATTRDTLVYKDGDRVQGVLVTRQDDMIVFKSDRFGELRVPAADAVVILAEKLEAPTPAATPTVVA